MIRFQATLAALVMGGLIAPASAEDDVCVYKTQDWSLMRGFLVEFSRQKINKDVAKAARAALDGAKSHSIGWFEVVYAGGKSGQPAPNDRVCYPRAVNFTYLDEADGGTSYRCDSTWRVDETMATLKCELVAG